MDIRVKTRFNSAKQRVESFGNNRYIAYLPFGEDEDSMNILISLLSKQVGMPPTRIVYKYTDERTKDMIFQVI